MTARTGECCGYGLDQLAYNTEFTRIPRLMQLAYEELQFTETTTISMPERGQRMLFSPIDAATGSMTLDPANSFEPDYREIDKIFAAADPPAKLYYFALPNFENTGNLNRLAELYGSATAHDYAQAGYTLTVHEFER